MQIIHTSSLYAEEENRKKNVHRQQKERRDKKIVNIGDQTKCPQCSRIGRVIWISQDGKQAGIRCMGHHNQLSRGISKYGSAARPQTKTQKNMVFLMDTETIALLPQLRSEKNWAKEKL